MIIPLIKKRNKPKVNNVIGIVRISRIGFKKVLRNDKTKATINAAGTPESLTPESNSAVINTARAETSILRNQFFMIQKCFPK